MAEEEAGRVLYRTTFGTQKAGGAAANAFDIRLKSPANTNVIATSRGSLLALWEAGPPYELDASSLRCLGPSDLGGRISLSRTHGALPGTTRVRWLDRWLDRAGLLPLCDAVSAHPRRDAAARSTVAWSWRQTLVGDDIEVALHELPDADADGAARALPRAAAVRGLLENTAFAPHDAGLSARFALFLAAPTTVDVLPFVVGLKGPAQCTSFARTAIVEAGEGSTIHAVCRRGGGTVRYALPAGEAYHAVHHANAWEDEGSGTAWSKCPPWQLPISAPASHRDAPWRLWAAQPSQWEEVGRDPWSPSRCLS